VFNSRELNLGDFETLKGDSSQAIAQGKRKLKKKKTDLQDYMDTESIAGRKLFYSSTKLEYFI
jgi:hypothetical protein